MSRNNIVPTASAMIPTRFGNFKMTIYKSREQDMEHTVMTIGDIEKQPVLTRVHSQCLTGDTLFSLKCDCGQQLELSLQMIQKEGKGVLIYLSQEGRGIGLSQKIKAYELQEKGLDTVEANIALGLPADARDYSVASEILQDLGISEINLLTNNPDKIKQIKEGGIKVNRIPLETKPNKFNKNYLAAKKQKLGHILTSV